MNPLTVSAILRRREMLTRTGQGILAAGILGMASEPVGADPQPPDLARKPIEPPTPEPEPALPPEQRVGFAILGLGQYATRQILPAFSDCRQARVVALISGSPDKARKIAAQYGITGENIYGYQEMDRLQRNTSVQVVYVITPNSTHRDFTLAAFKAGKHVLCEKPIAVSSSDGETMIRAGRAANRLLMIGYRAHYEPFNLECIRLCRSGELGRIGTITADHGRQIDPSNPADQWRIRKELAGGGSLVDIGIYSLNAARYLTGEEPTEILAKMESPDDPRFREVEATVHWTLRFPSGTLANCSSSYDWLDTKRYRVQGSKGWLELDPATDYYRHHLRIGRSGEGDRTRIEEPQIRERSQFARQLDHMAQCVRENKTPRTPGEEGLRDMRYMEMIYEAARTGKSIKVR
ncbi:MAG: Gfo/Idh/MocA family oxidoreductase [Capsulimonadales bacterium]|nr:Gfo/Idh/MocA family oxidoreductase [Capsulimonadales bacterium]